MEEGKAGSSTVKPKRRYYYYVHTSCKHSPSCFECPLADCEASLSRAYYLNRLPDDIRRNRRMGQIAWREAANDTAVSAAWLRRWKGVRG